MKKIISFLVAFCMIMPLFTTFVGATESRYSQNAEKIASYILKNGKKSEFDEDHLAISISNEDYDSITTHEIIYDSDKHQLSFVFSSSLFYVNSSTMSMVVWNYDIATATVVNRRVYSSFAIYDSTLKQISDSMAYSTIDVQTYSEGTILPLTYTKKVNAPKNIDNIIRTDLEFGFNVWDLLLTRDLRFSLKDIGFVSYPYPKSAQNVSVAIPSTKTYGDQSFDISIEDEQPNLGLFTFDSSNESVAEVDSSGEITIVGAGSTIINVSREGNSNYADFSFSLPLTVHKKELIIAANPATKIVGSKGPELTYQIDGLVNGDQENGTLERVSGEKVGTYEIRRGTVAKNLEDNYTVTFNKATFEIVDKLRQNVIVTDISQKIYGDDSFQVIVTPDEQSGLAEFTYESSNPTVAEINSKGNVTIKNAGKTDITVKQAGNDDYAPFEKKQTLTVNKVTITVTADAKSKKIGSADPELTYTYTGNLVGNDVFTGKLSRKAGEKVGKYDILQGTLALSANYTITYNKAVFEIFDKTPQNITVSAITDKTYGDQGFTVSVTPDSASGLSDFTFASSNPTVAAIDAQGNVTVKNAGTTVISVKQAGNDDYAPFEKKQTLTVKKVAVTVTADAKSKKIGSADPELTYTYTGNLVGNDAFTGKLSRKAGEKVGKYDILQGTLALSANYTITYNKAVFEIFDKTPQNITVSKITGKTYGDESFRITVTPDENAKLSDFTFESSDKTVATIDADGTIAIVGAGESEITVKQAGNADYAPFTGTQKLTVAPKAVAITAINLEAETVTFDTEFEKVTLDFTALVIGKPEQVDEETSKVTLSNFVLTGENTKNYTVSNKSFETTIANESLITVSVTAENGTITGNGTYVKGSEVTLTAQPKSGYRLDGWYIGSKRVSTETTYTFKAGETIPTVKFAKKSSGGSSGGSSGSGSAGGSGAGGSTAATTYTVRFESNWGSFVRDRKVTKNGILAKPEDPVRKGYIFGGWYTDAGLTAAYDFNTRVNANFTLYAKWTEKKADVWANPFADVSENEWFYGAVEYAAKNGLMNGVSDNEFAPNAALTRAMFVTVLYRMENEPETANAAFTDVVSGSWYEKAVAWAYAGGLVTGVSETEFAPEDTITREQMAAILYRYAKFKGMDVSVRGETSYTDKDAISDYAADAVIWAATKAVMSGNADGSFAPADNATRAEAAAVFMKIQEILK